MVPLLYEMIRSARPSPLRSASLLPMLYPIDVKGDTDDHSLCSDQLLPVLSHALLLVWVLWDLSSRRSGKPSPLTSTNLMPLSGLEVVVNSTGGLNDVCTDQPLPVLSHVPLTAVPRFFDWMISGRPSPLRSTILAPVSLLASIK